MKRQRGRGKRMVQREKEVKRMRCVLRHWSCLSDCIMQMGVYQTNSAYSSAEVYVLYKTSISIAP